MKFCFESKSFIECDKNPNKLAIQDIDRKLTWNEFKNEVSLLIDFFKENGLDKTDKPLMIYGHKQAEMLISMFACISMEIPYIPIDQIYPIERLQKIAVVSELEIIINCSNNPINLENVTIVQCNNSTIQLAQKSHITAEVKNSINDPLVYILFTSGSTGEPKGVQISSEAINSFSRWMTTDFGFTENDVFFNIILFTFDVSVYEIVSFASLGATVILNNKETCDNQEALLNRIQETKATVWNTTPSFTYIYSRIMDDVRFSSLKYCLLSGEILKNSLASTIKKNLPDILLYNAYGPTEATVTTTFVEVTTELIEKYNPLPIGFPKRESQIILENMNTEGVGEIVIVGPHVSVGYLKRDDLNQKKFFVYDNERAFRTGDLGYYKDDMVFFIGRNDDQIKWNGFRIELDEITNNLIAIPEIKEAITVPLKRNEEVKKIISFVQVSSTQQANELKEKIKAELKEKLPYYMIPGDIAFVDTFPINQSFKIDKAKLIEEYLKNQFA